LACSCAEPALPASLVPGQGLEGYSEEITAAPGERIRFMLSGGDAPADIAVVRMVHGDPNPDGPGARETPVDWGQPRTVHVGTQPLQLGSHIEVPAAEALSPAGSFTFALWFLPTLLQPGWHALGAKWGPSGLSYGLFCGGDSLVTAGVSTDGLTAAWCTGAHAVELNRWQFAAMTYEPATGLARVYLGSKRSTAPVAAAVRALSGGAVHTNHSPLLLGAAPCQRCGRGRWAHFNGKLSRPVLLDEALDAAGIESLMSGADPGALAPVLGRWQLASRVSGVEVPDASPSSNSGVAVNAPARAVTGPGWEGEPSQLYTDDPGAYDAVHVHDDDLDDAGWAPTLSLRVDPAAPSGLYAVRVDRNGDSLVLPFVVRPARKTSELALVLPTLTWQAYGSNRPGYSHTDDGVLDRGVALYDLHTDGSLVYYASRRRPTRAFKPTSGSQTWGVHTITADLYLVDWLEARGFPYDAFADQDLHAGGHDLLRTYGCVLLGSHPEYCTGPMMRALKAYVRDGGRLMYLGGNGLYWVTSIDEERPHLMEVRKSHGQFLRGSAGPGEWQHSTTLEVGGTWTRRGLPARDILGVEYGGNCVVAGDYAFRRLAPSWDDRYAFVFDGVTETAIGAFGLNMGSAAGIELDCARAAESYRGAAPVVLARALHPSFFPTTHDPVTPSADIALTTFEGGGAAFAAGSITWSGSLSHDGYRNNVSRITENVLRRFLDVPRGAAVV
jgi:N,N-dimethylformamidase